MNRLSWKEIIVGTLAGLSVLTSPAIGTMSGPMEGSEVRVDNQGPISLNSGHGSLNSGPGSLNSGSGSANGGHHGGDRERKHGKEHLVAQVNDVRQEDRRADRREDRQNDRREEQQLDRREDRREDRQMDRRQDRQETHRSVNSAVLTEPTMSRENTAETGETMLV